MSALAVSPYAGLEPVTWRSLLARAAVFHAARRMLGRLSDVAEQLAAVQVALIELGMISKQYSDQDCDDVTAVATVAREWEAVLARNVERTDEPEARQLLAELQELVGSASGEDPFHHIFHGIQAYAQVLYGASWRPSRLSVAHTRSHPRRGSDLSTDPYPVTAYTPWPPDPQMAEVELRIWCDQFSPAAYAALPILLTHEFVCHVPARQDRAKNDSEFAEGFLDWAAYYFLDRWVGKVDPQLAPAARRHAERLKQVLAARPAEADVRARHMGHQAAENLVAWFESECDLSSEESQTRVALLAVELNSIDQPLNAKDSLVVMLSWSIPPKVEAGLRSWVSGSGQVSRLLEIAGSSS